MTTQTPTLPRLLTAKDVAGQLGIPLLRVYEMVRDQGLPSIRLGRSMRFDPGGDCLRMEPSLSRARAHVAATAAATAKTSGPGGDAMNMDTRLRRLERLLPGADPTTKERVHRLADVEL